VIDGILGIDVCKNTLDVSISSYTKVRTKSFTNSPDGWRHLLDWLSPLRRREFITLLGGAAAWPLAARAQQTAMPVVGFLSSLSAPVTSKRIASFGQGLSETGYTAGRDVTIERRLAEGQYERLPALAADLVNRRVNLIAALAPPAAFAARASTPTIPIVFVAGFDPVKSGLVASLNRPGGNVTGITFIVSSLGSKRLELARELVPNVGVIAVLTHPHSPDGLEELRDLQSAAKIIGQQLVVVTATSDRDFEPAFAYVLQHHAGVLIIGADPFFFQSNDSSSRWRPDIVSRHFIRPARTLRRAA
jgi:putative ABC transport system substrate-binding protein